MNTSRRSFLKKSALAATAPFILPSRVWSAHTQPNDQITMGFIGMGIQNEGLLHRFLSHDEVRVLAVCDVDTNRREHAQRYVDDYARNMLKGAPGECKGYADFRELIAQDNIDAVCIATPDHWHAHITIAALRAGKDVYCEKPLTHNIHEAIEVMKEVDANKRVLQTGSMQRSMKEFRVACELVRGGAIGKIDHVLCSFDGPGVPCDLPEEEMEPGLDWDMWLGPAPMRPYSSVLSPRGVEYPHGYWRDYKEYGGGMVCDWGAHHLDIAQWALGMDESGPVKATPPDDPNAKTGAVLTYANGITVTQQRLQNYSILFAGSKGEIKLDRGVFELTLEGKKVASAIGIENEAPESDAALPLALRTIEKEIPEDQKERLYNSSNHITDFLDCMKSRKKPITHDQIGGRSAICCHLMNQAYYNQTEIHWDPEKLTFANGTGNPEWLTRDYRAPWLV